MRLSNSSLAKPLAQNLFALIFCALTVLLASAGVQAQSGRRAPRGPSPVPAPPAPTPEPELKSQPPKTVKPSITLIVAMNDNEVFGGIPPYVYQDMMRSFAARLKESPAVAVTVAEKGMFRGEAVKRAKSEKEAYVVWFELERDSMASQSRATTDVRDLMFHYAMFAPETAKVKAEGRTYPRAYSRGGVVIGPNARTGGPFYDEYLLQQAAVDAADRILGQIDIAPPPRPTR